MSQQPPFLKNENMFGHRMLKYFSIEPDDASVYFNRGAHGIIPTPVIKAKQKLYFEIEENPEKYYRCHRDDAVADTLQMMANYLHIKDWKDLVFIDNVSQGTAIVFHSLLSHWNDGHQPKHSTPESAIAHKSSFKILRFSTCYETVIDSIKLFNQNPQLPHVDEVVFEVTHAMLSNDKLLLRELEKLLGGTTAIDIAFISHISSIPGNVYNVRAITALLHQYGIIVCVDAAHALGQLSVDISEINPDIYLMNGYKWFYSPRGSGLMFVNKQLQHLMYPLMITDRAHRYNDQFHLRFSYLGLKDYVPWLAMKNALQFRQQFGDASIMEYTHKLAIRGGERVAQIWKTELFFEETHVASMVNVVMPPIPKALQPWDWKLIGKKYGVWLKVHNQLYGKYNVARFSTAVFHEIQDFEKTAHAILYIIDSLQPSKL